MAKKKKVSTCVEQLKNCITTQRFFPGSSIIGMLVGPPAVAKTSYVRALADAIGYELITVVASRLEPTDLSGFPGRGVYTREDGSQVPSSSYAPWDWQLRVMDKKKVVLFFDEFSNTNPSVQAVLLSMLQDRQFPSGLDGKPMDFPKETIVIGAMNPTEESADGFDISPPMANRMSWIPWNLTVREWLDALEQDFDSAVVLSQVEDIKEVNRKEVSANYEKWKNLVSEFISKQPAMLHVQNTSDVLKSGQAYGISASNPSVRTMMENAWASRRSWKNLIDMLSCLPAKHQDDASLIDAIAQSTIGVKASSDFRRFLNQHTVLNAVGLFKNPHKWDSERYATLSPEDGYTITRYLTGLNPAEVSVEEFENICTFFELVCKNNSQSVFGNILDKNDGGKQSVVVLLRNIVMHLSKQPGADKMKLRQLTTRALSGFSAQANASLKRS